MDTQSLGVNRPMTLMQRTIPQTIEPHNVILFELWKRPFFDWELLMYDWKFDHLEFCFPYESMDEAKLGFSMFCGGHVVRKLFYKICEN